MGFLQYAETQMTVEKSTRGQTILVLYLYSFKRLTNLNINFLIDEEMISKREIKKESLYLSKTDLEIIWRNGNRDFRESGVRMIEFHRVIYNFPM